jgi:hypothetical protein
MILAGRRKAMILGVGAIALIVAGWWFAKWAFDRQREHRFNANVAKIITLMAIPNTADPATKFDLVRGFIHEHSRHKSDAEFRRISGNKNLMAEGLIAHATGQVSEPVHMECSRRSNLMAAVMRELGYQTRIVYVFDTDAKEKGKLRSHTFLDVLNPSTGQWESHDPDYDFFWRSISSGERVSVFEMPEDLSKIEPCHMTLCGWDLVSDEGREAVVIRDLIDIVSTVDKATNRRRSHFTSRADLKRVFVFTDRKGTFCEIMQKLCTKTAGARP